MSMSRPRNTNINPATKFFSWDSDQAKVKYFDKEQAENTLVDLPFNFIILDSLSTIKGYSSSEKLGYWSNEIRSTKSEPFIVKTKNGIRAEGLWEDISEELKAKGGKFTASIYIAYVNGKKLELCNIAFSGASIKEWFDFRKLNQVKDGDYVSIAGAVEDKAGRVVYSKPIFQVLDTNKKITEEALQLDEQLQEYLDKYFDYSNTYNEDKVKSAVASSNSNEVTETTEDLENSDIPF